MRTDFVPCAIQGKILLKSKPPAVPARLVVTADEAACGKSLPNRGLALSTGSGIANVIVQLENVSSGKPIVFEKNIVISDEKCDFYPKVLAVAQGQPVTFRNGDKIYNDFRAAIGGQVLFNIALPMVGQTFVKKMNKSGIADLYCNVHSWEHALIAVIPHPYFAVSSSEGAFKMEGVPPGRYTLTAIHEILGKKSIEVVVDSGKTNSAIVEY